MKAQTAMARVAKKLDFLLQNDSRPILEMAGDHAPKRKALRDLVPQIRTMLKRLYSVPEQLELIANSSSNFEVTEDTYRLFLRTELAAEYTQFLINRKFIRNYMRILKVASEYKSMSKQFEALGITQAGSKNRVFNVTLEDYKNFVAVYLDEIERYIDRSMIEEVEKRTIVELPNGGHAVVDPIPKAPKTFESEKIGSCEPQMGNEKAPVEKISPSLLAPLAATKHTDGKIHLIPGVSADNIVPRFEVFTDKRKYPGGLGSLPETNYRTFTEDFLYFIDLKLVHVADYEFTENLLIVCGRRYSTDGEGRSGYDCYRYFQGDLYFVDNITPWDGGPSYNRQCRHKEYMYSWEFGEFRKKFLDMRRA